MEAKPDVKRIRGQPRTTWMKTIRRYGRQRERTEREMDREGRGSTPWVRV